MRDQAKEELFWRVYAVVIEYRRPVEIEDVVNKFPEYPKRDIRDIILDLLDEKRLLIDKEMRLIKADRY